MIMLLATEQQLNDLRKKLPVFQAHDLRSLYAEGKAINPADADAGTLVAYRRRNDDQLRQLLRSLGIDPSHPDAYLRGFFWLAILHHGAAGLAWRPRRTNRNAATWTPTADYELLMHVIARCAHGVSERRAIKQIVADPKLRKLFPYDAKGRFPTGNESKKREAALRARLQKLKASARAKSLLDVLLGPNLDEFSPIKRNLHILDMVNGLSLDGMVKNETSS